MKSESSRKKASVTGKKIKKKITNENRSDSCVVRSTVNLRVSRRRLHGGVCGVSLRCAPREGSSSNGLCPRIRRLPLVSRSGGPLVRVAAARRDGARARRGCSERDGVRARVCRVRVRVCCVRVCVCARERERERATGRKRERARRRASERE